MSDATPTGPLEQGAIQDSLRRAAALLHDESERALSEGQELGRYRILGRIAEGGMGRIYRARDERLGRAVALKVVRGDRVAMYDDDDGRRRLLRESQAAAAVSHPSIIQILDVDVIDGLALVSMELFEGQPFSAWIRDQQPHPRRIARCAASVAAALAVAHNKGLSHRDIKPANLLVGEGDHVKIVDFGLARMDGDAPYAGLLLSTRVTLHGLNVGSFHYRDPESEQGDAAMDRYALCATVCEALYGRIFRDGGWPPRRRPVELGRERVPRALRTLLHRELGPHADSRSTDTAALARELERIARGTAGWPALAVAGIAGATLVATWSWGRQATASPCEGVAGSMDVIWSTETREAIEHSFGATELPFAERAARDVDRRASEYAKEWRHARMALCEDQREGKLSADAASEARSCFEAGQVHFDRTLRSLSRADTTAVVNVRALFDGLPRVSACADRGLGDEPGAASWAASDRQQLQTLAELRTERLSGRLAGLDERLDAAISEPGLKDRGEYWASLHREAASLARMRGQGEDALAYLDQAMRAAERGSPSEFRAQLWLDRAELLGSHLKQSRAASEALAAAERTLQGVDTPHLERRYRLVRAKVAFGDDRIEEASETYKELLAETTDAALRADLILKVGEAERALRGHAAGYHRVLEGVQATREAWGDDHPHRIEGLLLLAQLEARRGEPQAAQLAIAEAESLAQRHYDDEASVHLSVASAKGMAAYYARDYLGAVEAFEQVLARADRQNSLSAVDRAQYLSRLGICASRVGQHDEAIRSLRAAIELLNRAVGTGHSHLVAPTMNLATAYYRAGRLRLALTWHDKAISKLGLFNGRGSVRLALARGDILLGLGLREQAREAFRTISVRIDDLGDWARLGLIEVDLASHSPAELARHCEALPKLSESTPGVSSAQVPHRSFCHFLEARRLELDGQRAEALQKARSALEHPDGRHDDGPALHTQIRSWIEAHGG